MAARLHALGILTPPLRLGAGHHDANSRSYTPQSHPTFIRARRQRVPEPRHAQIKTPGRSVRRTEGWRSFLEWIRSMRRPPPVAAGEGRTRLNDRNRASEATRARPPGSRRSGPAHRARPYRNDETAAPAPGRSESTDCAARRRRCRCIGREPARCASGVRCDPPSPRRACRARGQDHSPSNTQIHIVLERSRNRSSVRDSAGAKLRGSRWPAWSSRRDARAGSRASALHLRWNRIDPPSWINRV